MAIPPERLQAFKAALDAAARPLFFYDGDADGLTSFILLYKYKKEGKGIMISGRPQLTTDFVRKYEEYEPDAVFILDTAQLTQEFIDAIHCPIYWLDHHDPKHPELKLPKRMHYFNPRLYDDKDGRPTSFWAYQVTKENLWIAMIGVIGDYHFDDEMAAHFRTEYPDYLPIDITNQGKALFHSLLGELIRVVNFNLKGAVASCLASVKILARIEHPDEIMQQTSPRGKYLWKRYQRVLTHYQRLYNQALSKNTDEHFLIFIYEHDLFSLSGDLANELKYNFQDKAVVIGRANEGKVMMSLRSENYEVLPALQVALRQVHGYGGGHPKACGAAVAQDDFDTFLTVFKEEFLKQLPEKGKDNNNI
jgi:single-stranded DNA-specific DHH superfamily exonuclease